MKDIKVIIDIGNGYIKGVVFALDEGKTIDLAKEMIKTKGMRKGKILDIDDFIFSLNKLFEAFTKKIGTEFFDEVYIGISHPLMLRKRLSEQKRILGNQISLEDRDHISNLLFEASGESNYEIIKIFPVQWIIDDQIVLKDPLGMEGRKLEFIADVFMIPKNFYNVLVEVFEKLQIGIIDIIPNILAAPESVLDFDARDLGTLLIDIGNNQTSFVIYEEGYPLDYGVLSIGSEDITKDISIGLQIDIQEAEKIKREKGIILIDEEKIEDTSINVGFLSEVISARYEEIFIKINDYLIKIEKDGKLPGGVILIGGGAKMKNLDKLAKNIFKLATFYGKDKILNRGEFSANLQFINLIGINVWTDKFAEQNKSSFKFNLNFGIWKKIVKFFKDLI